MSDEIVVAHEESGHRGAFVVDRGAKRSDGRPTPAVVRRGRDAVTERSDRCDRDGARLAEMTYTRAGADLVIIDHTDVSDALRGQGVGKKLVEAAVAWAREGGVKLLPLCPFARSVFDRHPELHDVLAPP